MNVIKNDFIELEFIGKVKEGEIFDTNIASEAEKIGITIDENPFIICIGHEMVIKGLDNAFEGKEIGKRYSIELFPKDAFKERNASLVKLMPLNLFKQKNVNPYPGMTLALDNMLVRIVSVSGGRVLVDFNNPLSGKIVIYEFTIKRKIDDIKDKVNAILAFFVKQKLDFEIEEKEKKITFNLSNIYKPLIAMLNDRFNDVLKMEMVIEDKPLEKVSKDNDKPLEKVVENKDSHTSDSNEPKVSKDEENKPEKE
ncbi:MAG: peptidylprolyl isomerase [Nanoarchaeota archaeon]